MLILIAPSHDLVLELAEHESVDALGLELLELGRRGKVTPMGT